MSDLISRSELIKKIKDHKDYVKCKNESSNQIYGLAHDHIIDLVKIQPTAYNVEKVVVELEEQANEQGFCQYCGCDLDIENTINIVKKRGII